MVRGWDTVTSARDAARLRAWEQFVRTGVAPRGVRQSIARSWARCRELGLDPLRPQFDTLPKRELRPRLAAYRPLIELARPLMRRLVARRLPGAASGAVALLADTEGVLLAVIAGRGAQTTLAPGWRLSEDRAGTCAVALALREGRPAVVAGAEHYHEAYHDWICWAAPIRLAERRPSAVLAVAVRGTALDARIRVYLVECAAALAGVWRAWRRNLSQQVLLGPGSPWPLIAVDGDGRVLDCNPAAERELGLLREKLVGRRWEQLGFVAVQPGEGEAAPDEGQLVSLTGAGGERSFFLMQNAPLPGGAGERPGRVYALVNITRWRERLEQADYRRRLALLERLGAFVVHEARNPLAAIRVSAELAAMTPDPERRTALMQQIIASVDDLNRFLGDLLDLVRPKQAQRGPVDVGVILQRVVELFAPQAKMAGVDLRVRAVKGALPVIGNEHLLGYALGNLVRNALQATPAGGAVSVRVERRPSRGSVLIRVSDTGAGIPPGIRRHLLTAAVSTKGRYEAGLGLLLSHRVITEAHGGRVWFRTREGAGTTFYVELPLAAAPMANTDATG